MTGASLRPLFGYQGQMSAILNKFDVCKDLNDSHRVVIGDALVDRHEHGGLWIPDDEAGSGSAALDVVELDDEVDDGEGERR